MKRKNISKNITRYLLSDVLPYEVPITFSNYSMVDFFNRIGLVVQLKDKENDLVLRLSWDDKFVHDNEKTLLFYLFDGDGKAVPPPPQVNMMANSFEITNRKSSISFDFYTTRNNGQLRKLSVVSPRYQLFMMWYYQQFSDVILYFCHRSNFSIRYPQKIAEWKYYRDYSHYLSVLACDQKVTIEEFDNEYESLKSFFSYREFSNIHRFYESNLYHRIEQKFRYLKKVDISKCFDSLYTHSVTWFVYGKSYIKDNLHEGKGSFVGILDKLMQDMNYAETHGIVIGPEFSRIFAEIILQAIDSDVESELREQKLFNKNQYQICRYVDDYFVFYNDESIIQKVIKVLQEKLLENKLYLNQAKETDISRPIITNVSIAKCKIEKLFEDLFPKKLSEGSKEDGTIVYSLNIPRISSCTLILQYKSILAETSAGYQDVLNFSLAILERVLSQFVILLNQFAKKEKTQKDKLDKTALISVYCEVSHFIFFVFSSCPLVNVTIRVCRIEKLLIDSIKKSRAKYPKCDDVLPKDRLYKLIFDEISSFISCSTIENKCQVEDLYLFILANELGRDYQLPLNLYKRFLGISEKQSPEGPTYELKCRFNYFTISVMLFCIGNRKKYKQIHDVLEKEIEREMHPKGSTPDTERVLLLFDSLACPYLSNQFKISLCQIYGVNAADTKKLIEAVKKYKFSFTQWENFKFSEALDLKRGQEVY